jgi:hypothetical protein
MRKAAQSKPSRRRRPAMPRGKRGARPDRHGLNQATADEFEEQGMGVAPKE